MRFITNKYNRTLSFVYFWVPTCLPCILISYAEVFMTYFTLYTFDCISKWLNVIISAHSVTYGGYTMLFFSPLDINFKKSFFLPWIVFCWPCLRNNRPRFIKYLPRLLLVSWMMHWAAVILWPGWLFLARLAVQTQARKNKKKVLKWCNIRQLRTVPELLAFLLISAAAGDLCNPDWLHSFMEASRKYIRCLFWFSVHSYITQRTHT